MAALMYALGLSYSAASHIFPALGAEVCKMTVWRDAQRTGESLRRKQPEGRVRIMRTDETVFKVKGEEVVVGFVVDAKNGETLGFDYSSRETVERFLGGFQHTSSSSARGCSSPTTTIPTQWRLRRWAWSTNCA